jgi:GMP synthase-like glutamine amidotransferase
MILILQHIEIEGPGYISKFFKEKHLQVKIIKPYRENIPQDVLKKTEALVILGGPMNVDEEKKYSFLKEEKKFIKKALKKNIPILGICLGGQLLARIGGAKVKKAPYEEIGWFKIKLTDEGKKDLLFKGCPKSLLVFQWHEDEFEIPKDGVLLAKSEDFFQAFRLGKNAYGLQFHIEVTPKMIKFWINKYFGKKERKNKEHIVFEAYDYQDKYLKQSEIILNNFYQIIKNKE